MTPQERQLVAELFDRLATLEPEPRDPDAERVIAEGFRRAPHAAYALVQTVLVQDEALKRANARIEELQGMGAEEAPRQGGFLDNMRDTLLGRDERRGSVPSVRTGGLGSSGVWGPGPAAGAGAPPMGSQPMGPGMGGSPMGPGMGAAPMGPGAPGFGGGSFLGTAAASAAGAIGGAMMLNGIRSMFGHSPGTTGGASAFGSGADSPWGGSAANSDLARQAGLDNIGGDKSGGGTGERHAGLFGGDDHDDPENSGGFDDDTDVAGDWDDGDSDNA
ncbi:MAG TPA: DUF2076 domain-containing protein [Xanthobacteraceae bacterium]|jgi:hypothetical protein|nr:DUF2076 domain-containing protein [Xanthobacteraceae bacterium]